MLNRRILVVILAAVVVLVAGYVYLTRTAVDPAFVGEYRPVINPSEFTSTIANRYVTFPLGTKLTYESRGGTTVERVEIEALTDTKVIMGVETRVVRDRVWRNDVLHEDTRDYLAQDREGNVWYFGEDVDNYKDGNIDNHSGSWIAGVDGAQPGIWMKAAPQVGDKYRQEYYRGEAEDVATVLSISESVTVRGRTYSNCVKTLDTSLIELTAREHKYYCPEVAAQVLVEGLLGGSREELVNIQPRP